MVLIYRNNQKNEFDRYWLQFLETHQAPLQPVQDMSFLVIENNQCVGICYCPIYTLNSKNYIGNNEGYIFAPLADNKRIYKFIFEQIDVICQTYQCVFIKMQLDSLYSTIFIQETPYCTTDKSLTFKKFGYIDTSSIDTVFNLCLENSQIWQNLTKKYKSYINHMKNDEKNLIEIFNHKNPSRLMHDMYVDFHHSCSRRITRNQESFELQYQMLLDGFATLFSLSIDGEYVSFYYCFHYCGYVYVHSGSDNIKYEGTKIPIYHYLLYNILLYFKNKGYKMLSIGQPSNFCTLQGFGDYCDYKQINIAVYKRGMGGNAVPFIRGIKYYDKEYLKKDIEVFKEMIDHDA